MAILADSYKGNLKVKFQVYVNNKSVSDAKIEVFENGTKLNDFTTNEKGKVDIVLAFNKNYTINVTKNNCITNIFIFNSNLPKEEIDEVYTFDCYVDLFQEIQGVDFSIFNTPLVEVKFDDEIGGFDVSEERIDKLNKEIAFIREQIENIEIENNYKEAIATADKYFAQNDLTKAKLTYQKALNFKKNEKYTKEKINEIENILNKDNKDKTTYNLN